MNGEQKENNEMERELVTEEMLIPEVVSQYPSTREVFDKYGLKGCGGPEGPRETIEFFARAHCLYESG